MLSVQKRSSSSVQERCSNQGHLQQSHSDLPEINDILVDRKAAVPDANTSPTCCPTVYPCMRESATSCNGSLSITRGI